MEVQDMHRYFNQPDSAPKWRDRPRTTLPLTLQTDLNKAEAGSLTSLTDLAMLQQTAQHRHQWRTLCKTIVNANDDVVDLTLFLL